jgi:hypothetical protein
MKALRRRLLIGLGVLAGAAALQAQKPVTYFPLTQPQQVLPQAQSWESRGVPHTMAVLELNRGGYRYWSWYGLTNGGGVGLARSRDLRHWTKYGKNPILTNARWISALKTGRGLYFAYTRDFDTRAPWIAMGVSRDSGLHINLVKVLVQPVPGERNQNPNLFRDPADGRYHLTWYRGNNRNHFELVMRSAKTLEGLADAPDKVLISTSDSLMGPFLMKYRGVYYLAAESHRPNPTHPHGEWESHVFTSRDVEGPYTAVANDPVLSDEHGCPSEYVFGGKLYGFTCNYREAGHDWILEEFTGRLSK